MTKRVAGIDVGKQESVSVARGPVLSEHGRRAHGGVGVDTGASRDPCGV